MFIVQRVMNLDVDAAAVATAGFLMLSVSSRLPAALRRATVQAMRALTIDWPVTGVHVLVVDTDRAADVAALYLEDDAA